MDDDAGDMRRSAARWRVRLKGEAFDLEDLVELISSPDLRVVKAGADFFLESATFERLDRSVDVLEKAQQRIVPRLNGAGKLKRRGFRDVDVVGHLIESTAGGGEMKELVLRGSITPRGKVTHVVVQPATLELRARVLAPTIVVDGQAMSAEPGTLETDRWLELAERDPDVAEVLEIFGSGPHDWMNLYRVLEIIGGRENIVDSGWASGKEIVRFTRTANHPRAAGPNARHARSNVEPPPRPVTPEEGVEFVRRIAVGWLGSLVSP